MKNALVFLIDTFSQLYLLILLLRFWLPVVRANFHNPVSQGVLRYTAPLVIPVRRFIPAIGKLDTATVVVALLIRMLATLLILLISAGPEAVQRVAAAWPQFILAALLDLALLSAWMFIIALIVRVILSWVGRYLGPLSDLMRDLTEPLVRPIRRILPPFGGLDLSTYITIVLLIALTMVIADFRSMLF